VLQPSIQQVVASIGSDVLSHLGEEMVNTDAYTADISGVSAALKDLAAEFGPGLVDQALLAEAKTQSERRVQQLQASSAQTVNLPLGYVLDLPNDVVLGCRRPQDCLRTHDTCRWVRRAPRLR
jgi:hypothetical protein